MNRQPPDTDLGAAPGIVEHCVRDALERYFDDLGGAEPHALHAMVLQSAERPLLEMVLKRTEGNQSQAAAWLGINRNTLRRKLLEHKLTE